MLTSSPWKTGVKRLPKQEVFGRPLRFLLGNLNHRYRKRNEQLVGWTEWEREWGEGAKSKQITMNGRHWRTSRARCLPVIRAFRATVLGCSVKENCSGLPFPPPGNLPNPGTELMPLASPALAGRFFTAVPPKNGAKSWCRLWGAWLSGGDARCCYFLL